MREIGGQWGELQVILSLPYRATLSSARNDDNTTACLSGVQGFRGWSHSKIHSCSHFWVIENRLLYNPLHFSDHNYHSHQHDWIET